MREYLLRSDKPGATNGNMTGIEFLNIQTVRSESLSELLGNPD
jgi:hypothetical protein